LTDILEKEEVLERGEKEGLRQKNIYIKYIKSYNFLVSQARSEYIKDFSNMFSINEIEYYFMTHSKEAKYINDN